MPATSSKTSFFSFGIDESFISKSYEGLRYRDLPTTLNQLIISGSVVDVHWAALGPLRESWILSFKDREGKNNFGWGANIPPTLQQVIKNLTPSAHFRSFLGPSSSFIAWDPTFIRWNGLPRGLEAVLQSWLTPAGWKSGPPKLVSWGLGDAFIAMSEYGEVQYHAGSGDDWPLLTDTVDEWNAEVGFEWTNLSYIALDPTTTDQFFAIRQDRIWAGSINDSGEEALESFALNFFHLSKRKKSKPKDMPRTPSPPKPVEIVPSPAEQAQYEKWALEVAGAFASALVANGGVKAKAPRKLQVRNQNARPSIPTAVNGNVQGKLLSEFPYLPPGLAFCVLPSCADAKAEPGGLKACKHDVERLFRASGLYSYEWLRQERIRWHPDRFGRLCEEHWRETGRKLAEEMFKVIDSLITDIDAQRAAGAA